MTAGLAIVGYGKMGRIIERLAPEYGFDVRATLDSRNNAGAAGLTREALHGVDVAIEFSVPSAAAANLRRLSELGINTVAGTTGWLDELPALRGRVLANGSGMVWSPNFSIGMNLFLQTVARAAELFARHPEYEAWGWEIHHSAKKDAPSGTLHELARQMRAAGYDRTVNLTANRAGAHPGTHEIGFDSLSDTITLRHTARSREGFARGALHAARWIVGKKGFFEFREILGELH
ncbi:MAG TPA: dihydrodipicolinate reductase C-terminal domain-containing protein [Candidatus Acidoferrum sp.]